MSIDPREFGKLEAQVEALQGEVQAMRNDIKTLLELANKSKGGFWVGMAIASLIGGIIAFVADRLVLK
jgi:DNA anti-recombination protein RmuC